MEKLVVHGGFTLRGAVNISGSKNASLPILAASLLTDEPVVVRRVPDVSDTNFMVQIMGQLGASVERSSGNVRVEARNLHSEAAYEQVRKMRASHLPDGALDGPHAAVRDSPAGRLCDWRPSCGSAYQGHPRHWGHRCRLSAAT